MSRSPGIKLHGGDTIRKGTLIVEGCWYLSTSDDQCKKSYKLLAGEVVSIPVESIVQEEELEWLRRGRVGVADSILSQESHLALMRHNYSNCK